MIKINNTKILNLPEQVQANVQDIADLNTKMDAVAASQNLSNTRSIQATSNANQALSQANKAVSTSENAMTIAESVQGAIDTANEALTNANTALTNANTAEATAETFYETNKTLVETAQAQLENISTTNDATFGANVEVDGDLTLNSRDNIKFKDSTDTVALTSELTADYNALDTKIEANSTLIGTKANTTALDDFQTIYNNDTYQFKFAGLTITSAIEGTGNTFNPSTSLTGFSNATDVRGLFSNCTFDSGLSVYLRFNNRVNITRMCSYATHAGTNNVKLYLNLADGAYVNEAFNEATSSHLSAFYGIYPESSSTNNKFIGSIDNAFRLNSALVEIGAFDLSETTESTTGAGYVNTFRDCSSLKSIHCTHFKYSFDISASTAFEESDLVEIISNLDTVTTAQILTMGSTNLAKLTENEILVATSKGWTLA